MESNGISLNQEQEKKGYVRAIVLTGLTSAVLVAAAAFGCASRRSGESSSDVTGAGAGAVDGVSTQNSQLGQPDDGGSQQGSGIDPSATPAPADEAHDEPTAEPTAEPTEEPEPGEQCLVCPDFDDLIPLPTPVDPDPCVFCPDDLDIIVVPTPEIPEPCAFCPGDLEIIDP